MDIEICRALPSGATRIAVSLEPGATLADAVERSGILALPDLDRGTTSFAIHGRRATRETILRDGDRVEILRPLRVDPNEARLRRAAKKAADAARARKDVPAGS